jgi:hypothetical protein
MADEIEQRFTDAIIEGDIALIDDWLARQEGDGVKPATARRLPFISPLPARRRRLLRRDCEIMDTVFEGSTAWKAEGSYCAEYDGPEDEKAENASLIYWSQCWLFRAHIAAPVMIPDCHSLKLLNRRRR